MPPFRFAARVVADSAGQLRGNLAGVITPVGLVLESAPHRPVLFAPVGTRAEPEGVVLVLTLPGRVLTLRLGGVGYPDRLAADTAGYLAGGRPAPEPADYRHPWWLVGVGAGLALALAAGPLVLASVADLGTGVGLLLGLAFAAVGMAANAAVALLTSYRVGAKVALMAGACVALMTLFLFGATAYLTWAKNHAEPPPGAPGNPGVPTPGPPGPGEPSPGPPPEPEGRPPSHIGLAYLTGRSRLDDGPDEVTALAVSPADGAVIVGYGNGETRFWQPEQAWFDPPRSGPRADGAVKRIGFDTTGRILFLECPGGMVVASRDAPPRAPVKIPGEAVAAFPEPYRERFAALRAGKIQVRYIPMDLVKDPPRERAAKGVVPLVSQDETFPISVKADFNLPAARPTFLAWHPTAKVLWGNADGSIVTWPTGGPGFAPVTKAHQAAVRAWVVSPNGKDFATGDDAGFLGLWPDRSMTPIISRVGTAAVTSLSFSPWGNHLLVADASGGLTVWDVFAGRPELAAKRPGAKLAAFGPWDDVILVADGKGVEVWWAPALEKAR